MKTILFTLTFLFSLTSVADQSPGDLFIKSEKSSYQTIFEICQLATKQSEKYWYSDCDLYSNMYSKDFATVKKNDYKLIDINQYHQVTRPQSYGSLSVGDRVSVKIGDLYSNKTFEELLVQEIYIFHSPHEEFLIITDQGLLVDRFYVFNNYHYDLPNSGSKSITLNKSKGKCTYNTRYYKKSVIEGYFHPTSSFKEEGFEHLIVKTRSSHIEVFDLFFVDDYEYYEHSDTFTLGSTVVTKNWVYDQNNQRFLNLFVEQKLEQVFHNYLYYEPLLSGTVTKGMFKGTEIYTSPYSTDRYKISSQTQKANIRVGDIIVNNKIEYNAVDGKKVIGFIDEAGDNHAALTLVLDEDYNNYYAILCDKNSRKTHESCERFEDDGLYLIEFSDYLKDIGETAIIYEDHRC